MHYHAFVDCVHTWDLSHAFLDCVRTCGSLTCICGLCAHVWISRMHLWIVCARVDLSHAFVDCAWVCISRVHLWIVCESVYLSRAFVDCVRECGSLACICGLCRACGSLTCICGLCAHVWISHMHLWIVCARVDLSHAFVDCVRTCGSLACICGLCAHVWISHMHLWIVCAMWISHMHLWWLCARVWISRVHLCTARGSFACICVSPCGSFACICVSPCGSFVCISVSPCVSFACIFWLCACECGSLACICGRIWYCFHSIHMVLNLGLFLYNLRYLRFHIIHLFLLQNNYKCYGVFVITVTIVVWILTKEQCWFIYRDKTYLRGNYFDKLIQETELPPSLWNLFPQFFTQVSRTLGQK